MKKAFTLMEVNLAIMVMAVGILSIVGLYGLGFRENGQSGEDVAAAAYADAVLSPLVMALSSPEIKWSDFRSLKYYPSDNGWADYFDNDGNVQSGADGIAKAQFSEVMSKLSASHVPSAWPQAGVNDYLTAGLVIMHDQDSAIVRIAFRASKQAGTLLSAPLFYTEVRFQGKVDIEDDAEIKNDDGQGQRAPVSGGSGRS